MTIEFVGLPGVGKSTIARALEKHGFVRVRIYSKGELLLRNIQYFFIYPLAFFKTFFWVLRVGIRYGRLYQLFMNVFLDTNARIVKTRFLSKPSIIDQGHLQGFLSLSYHAITDKEIIKFRRFLPKIDHTFFFVLDETVRQQRLSERGYGPRENESNPHNTLWKNHLLQNTKNLYAFLEKDRISKVTVINTAEEVQKNISFITNS